MSASTRDVEIRHALHELREPLGSFALNVELLGKFLEARQELSADAATYMTAMQDELVRARAAFDEMSFLLENGHARPANWKR